MRYLFILCCLTVYMIIAVNASPLETKDHVETEIITFESSLPSSPSQSVLLLDNIHGEVNIEGYSGNKIKVEVRKRVQADSKTQALKGLQELIIAESYRRDTIELVLDFPWKKVGQSQGTWFGKNGFHRNGWQWNPDYEFQLDFTIKVPSQMKLDVSTVNKGDVRVEGVLGNLTINNVNGGIELVGVQGQVQAKTINGNIQVSYASLPQRASQFFSHNGTIRFSCPNGLSAKMYFKSHNGDFFTNIQSLVYGPQEATTQTVSDNSGITYLLNSRSPLISRSGETMLEFETFNGDVYVEEGK